MKRAVMTVAVMMAAASVMLGGCGNSAGANQGQDSGGTAQESRDAEGQNDDAANDSASQESAGGGEFATDEAQEGAADENGAEETARLKGTSISILGDSISTFQGYNPTGYAVFFPEFGDVEKVEDTWWQMVADDLELTLHANGSSSGSTVAGDSTGMDDPRCGCNELRTNDLAGALGACPDRIVIYMGTNDMLESVPLGDNDGTRLVEEGDVATFSDAYTLMLDKLQANYPLAEFYCCTLLPIGDYGTKTPYVEFVNSAQLTEKDYGAVIARIAESRGHTVIDLYDCGVTIENLQEMTSDGVHPTVEGMRRIAEAVEKALVGQEKRSVHGSGSNRD